MKTRQELIAEKKLLMTLINKRNLLTKEGLEYCIESLRTCINCIIMLEEYTKMELQIVGF